MNELVVLAMPGGPAFVDALRRTWDDGDAVLPLDPRLPTRARDATLAAMAPAFLLDEAGVRHRIRDSRPVESGDAVVVATSGTTGEPRGVVLSHDAVTASARATSARIGVVQDDHWLACLPLAHVGGLSVVMRAIVTETALTVLPWFDADAVTNATASGANLVSLVATTLSRIDPSRFRVIVLGGSRPPRHRPPNCLVTYGMTETGSGVVYDGVPLDGVEVRIDETGEILLRGPMLLRSYRDGSDPRDQDGWLPTGDIGRWGPDGRLQVDGRAGDLIITGGENVWPEAVEAVLATHPDVAEVAVAGQDDPEWGQIVVAYIVPTDSGAPPPLDDLRRLVKAQLPGFCAPRALIVRSALPKTGIGKVARSRLSKAVDD